MTPFMTYVKWLHDYKQANHISGRPETPVDLNVKTLWVPCYSGNRTATLDLNHEIGYEELTGFPIHVKDISDLLQGVEHTMGWNGNCETAYIVVEVPTWWTYDHVLYLAELCCKELNRDYGGPGNNVRVLKADVRMVTIVSLISKVPQSLTINQ